MLQIVLWALATGFVTGAVWFAIISLRRPAAGGAPVLPPSADADAAALDDVNRRLVELEERVDATEYLVRRDRIVQPREPPS
jgi:hypothetical protein